MKELGESFLVLHDTEKALVLKLLSHETVTLTLLVMFPGASEATET